MASVEPILDLSGKGGETLLHYVCMLGVISAMSIALIVLNCVTVSGCSGKAMVVAQSTQTDRLSSVIIAEEAGKK